MRRLAPSLFAVLAALSGRPPAAQACSLSRRYIEPTRVELVAKADLVVVASAKKETDGVGEPEVELEVARVIKGRGVAAGDRIRAAGILSRWGSRPEPRELSNIRPADGCWPGGDYSPGTRYVVILRSYPGGWQTLSSEVESPIWLRAVEEYARVAALAGPARRAALDELVASGEEDGASPIDRMISYDVELHLVTATPYKAFLELLPMLTFEDIPRVAGMMYLPRRDDVVLAIGVGGDPAAREWIRARVRDARRGRPLVDQDTLSEAIAAWLEEVPDPVVLAEVGELYLSLARRRARSDDNRESLMSVLIDQADDRHQDLMLRALIRADREEAGQLAYWFVRHPALAAFEHVASRVGTAYPRNHLFSQALAGMGDDKVVAWARRARRRKRSGELPLYVLALSPRAEADAEAGKLIAAGAEELAVLIDGYGWARHDRAAARLKEIGARRLTAAQREALDRTLAQRARRWLGGSD